ncbi:nuclear transport factor 2 family protein [Parvularcula flava]|uniref:Nuclear transport factor 2 family protein n=1 Tax=Aquisalinus luteolus TaxID=1566827 RepID=A0A8J3A299_9PROT|nr:nuclear transport factor 2 family protein [Aquisalinus luteolus]NHK27179.1 nuclear transport factor 2 family protein [Aquisalinus luteolus]GGH94648.1 hypothetical protein GCM10011355_09330 [Aquisalinus luteolus]
MSKIHFVAYALLIMGTLIPNASALGADNQSNVADVDSEQQALLELSSQKWDWMAEKDVGKLETLFDANAKFVHMSGTWKTEAELDIIESGRIWYKNADVHDVAVEMFGDTAIVWSRITLVAVVGGNEVSNEFTVTEVYQHKDDIWKMLALTFSSVRDTHSISH